MARTKLADGNLLFFLSLLGPLMDLLVESSYILIVPGWTKLFRSIILSQTSQKMSRQFFETSEICNLLANIFRPDPHFSKLILALRPYN